MATTKSTKLRQKHDYREMRAALRRMLQRDRILSVLSRQITDDVETRTDDSGVTIQVRRPKRFILR